MFPYIELGFMAWYLLREDFSGDRYDTWEGNYEDHARSRLKALIKGRNRLVFTAPSISCAKRKVGFEIIFN